MKKFTYNGTVHNHYSKRRRNSLLLGTFNIFGSMFFGEVFKAEFPDINHLLDGRMNDAEQLGFFGALFTIVMFGLCIFDAMTAANALQGVELSCVEVFKSHVLIVYNSQTSSNKPPVKGSIRLEYTDIQKIDYETDIPKWQRTNFSVYHRNGVVELCLDDAEEAAMTIGRALREYKEHISFEENKSKNNGSGKSGENFADRKRIGKPVEEAASIGICPRCGAEFELFDSCKEIRCPVCFSDLEF